MFLPTHQLLVHSPLWETLHPAMSESMSSQPRDKSSREGRRGLVMWVVLPPA
jgi:hypothetical protein